jgi:hypothetical protein
MTPVSQLLNHLLIPTPTQQWLLSVRGLAKQLNEQSTREAGGANNAPASNNG